MWQRLSMLLVACFVAATMPLQAIAQQTQPPAAPQPPQWYWPGPWMMWSDGWAFWWVCPLMMLFMLLVVGVIFLVTRRSHGPSGGPHHWEPPWRMGDPSHSALQILGERFARGEIQKEEYDHKKAAILSGGQR